MVNNNRDFIMSPKIDFAFKLIFGDEKNKNILLDFLCATLNLSDEDLMDIEFINCELPKEFENDKKGILDIRVKTRDEKQINVEIQLLQSKYMPERTLFYWSKMYTGQIKSGNKYNKLKKCITINIVNYKFLPINRIHTKFHLLEDDSNYKLTDAIEIHFLELPKLNDKINAKDVNDEKLIEWLEFLNAESKGVMEVLAKKNKNIGLAYEILESASRDEKKRLAYESRQIAIMDEETRLEEAIEKGIEKGIGKGELIERYKNAKAMKKEKIDIEIISKVTGLSIKDLKKI